MPRILRISLIATTVAVAGFALAGTAAADDAHQACHNTVACTGNVIDLHDVTTTLHDVTLNLLGG